MNKGGLATLRRVFPLLFTLLAHVGVLLEVVRVAQDPPVVPRHRDGPQSVGLFDPRAEGRGDAYSPGSGGPRQHAGAALGEIHLVDLWAIFSQNCFPQSVLDAI